MTTPVDGSQIAAIMSASTKPVATGSTAATGGTAAAGKPDALGKDTFLKLLVAQLKYQNPDSPTDGAQYLAQTAQFSMVEKLDDLTKGVTALLAAQQSASAAGMLGRTVAWTDAGKTVSGVVSAVHTTAAGPVLRIGTGAKAPEIPLSAVQDISATPAPAAPSGTASAAPTTQAAPAQNGDTGTTAS